MAADETVATAVYARAAKDYKRERQKDGSFKPEFYGLANGGRIAGTGSDVTVDRVTYPEVAQIAARLLAQQNYHYAQSAKQADLMIVLHWGTTIAFNSGNYSQAVNQVATSMAGNGPQGMGSMERNMSAVPTDGAGGGGGTDESAMLMLMAENRARDQINLPNARLLGYLDDINDSDDIRRWAGGGDRYNDLMADIEESRYYIIVSAYDFDQLVNHQKKVLRWQTRVSVRAPGNRFDDSFAAMLKGASKYFGQDSGRLKRGEESKGTVELGDLKFLGEAKEQDASQAGPKK
ncbi:hypothetical protein ESB00_16330 [Oleiharenicola lentus]|uniref:Uncharacterized protein n=1 Tax=Oleiharenicola lentus TaxID=2508720 RepID=A0A4Q1C4Q0_9BACT|nr:hypothetical protein [Oleiharenicola lentus]RXK53265.1 hypothetical protein ESB00_16330 [Oleiharenicola lentus]